MIVHQFEDPYNDFDGLWFIEVEEVDLTYLHRDLVVRNGTTHPDLEKTIWLSIFDEEASIPSYQIFDAYTGYFLTEAHALQAIKDYNDIKRTR